MKKSLNFHGGVEEVDVEGNYCANCSFLHKYKLDSTERYCTLFGTLLHVTERDMRSHFLKVGRCEDCLEKEKSAVAKIDLMPLLEEVHKTILLYRAMKEISGAASDLLYDEICNKFYEYEKKLNAGN